MNPHRHDSVICEYCGIEFEYRYDLESCPNCDGTGDLPSGGLCSLCGGSGSYDPNGNLFLCLECQRDNGEELDDTLMEDDEYDSSY